ncbi:MAG: hypothetical protein ACPGQV_01925 [Alphaproteobacteria bacterium]
MSEVPETAEVGSGEEYDQSADTYSTPDDSWTAGLPSGDAEFAYAKGWENTIDLLLQYRDLEAIVSPDQVQIQGGDATLEKLRLLVSNGPSGDAGRVQQLTG